MSTESNGQPQHNWLELSLAQQSVWLDAKLSGSSVYQLGGWARFKGTLDESVVKQSVRLIMARHDALRLRVDDELPRQWLDDSGQAPVEVIDLHQAEDPDAAFAAHVDKVFASPMPLGNHPLFRIELLRAGPKLSYVLWRFHHLIADSASVSIALGHLLNAYDALTASEPQELTPPSSYLKTIESDARYLQSAQHHQDLAYWTSRFDPLPQPLIADMEARADTQSKVPVADCSLTGKPFAEFSSSARTAGVTVNRALFALFSMALGRRYGQKDVVAGIALHRRDLSNLNVLGMVAGVMGVRWQFEPEWSLDECVISFSEQLDADLRHQRLPVDILSRALGLSGTGRAGLFEAAMSYIPATRQMNESALEGLPVTTGSVETKEASPISLHAQELPGNEGLSVHVAVNPDFLDPAEAKTLSSLLQSAISEFVRDAGMPVEELPGVSTAELELVTHAWNQTTAAFANGTLDGLFAKQAKATPDAIAVVGLDGDELSYAELDARSNRLAKHLLSVGVGPEKVVGVKMTRSTDTVIAILGILKAGGAYLPLDPAYPPERLEYIAANAGAMLVLEAIEGQGEGLNGQVELPVLNDPSRLAYVIYTSGTTGQPKGVAVPHSAAVNLAFARRACHDPLGVGDRVLAAISVGFDVSIGQLLLPLLSGATVVIAGDVKTMGAAEFWSLLADRKVTHINSVPSFFDSILESAPPAGTLSLKRLMLGGEALSGALVGRIHQAIPGIEVVNMYGPTEACIDATYHVATEKDLALAVLPIGRPLSNYQAYVLDGQKQPVGVGVSGELYLGGAGLARGYVNAAELTTERFVQSPFQPGAKLYKTGDRARWTADGNIEFLGRVDQQVKIRGFRVEPGEIEAQLMNHPGIAQAVVVPRSSKPGAAARLIAYIVADSAEDIPETTELREHLSRSLPEYMIPSAFVAISEIPLNRNGKLDVNALPSPDLTEGEYVEPRTATEQTIANLFSEVLGLDRCGVTDHFFELGGHSLLATSLVSRLHALGMVIPLRAIFETPTVEMLARRIDASLPAVAAHEPIPTADRNTEIPLSFPQERIWFINQLQQDSSYNIPIAFELKGQLNVAAAERAIQRIVARHEALRTRIVLHEGRPLQKISDAAELVFDRVDLTELQPDERQRQLKDMLQKRVTHQFDLASDLPFDLLLVRLEDERHVLAMVIHHVAFDGWSAGIFFKEFAALYLAFSAGNTDPLPMPAIQYADFAAWQRRQNYQADLAFWLEVLQDAPARLELPFADDSQGSRQSDTAALRIEPPLYSSLVKLANDNGASLFMVLHAAFSLLMSRMSGQEDVVIGTVTANRNRSELESVIGCFVNTVPLRTLFKAGESFTKLLSRVKSDDLAAYAHQELPFEQLVEALTPERSLQHTPIFQVMFVLQNAPMAAAQLPSLTVRPMELPAESAKLDLTLSLAETDGGITGTIEFARNRFDADWINRLGEKFRRVLNQVVLNPEAEALAVHVLDESERQLIVETWNQTASVFANGTLDGLFTAQVSTTPDAVAVVGLNGDELSYRELDDRSTRLAKHLLSVGVGPEKVVGVKMTRSTDTVIAILGILKAGGAYLPLDPAYPPERLEYIAANAGAMLVLESIDGLSGDAELPTLVDHSRLAYVIYTSGTTGQPKGVAVPHSAAVNLAFARRACHDPLGVGDRVLAAISVGFDVSIGQLLLPLLSGATVVIAGDVKTMGAGEFWSLLADRKVTHINSVPSFFDSILESAPPAGTLSLKRLMLGGEALSGALVGRIHQAIPGIEVVNMYGPTEACIDATYHVATEKDLALAVLPIGRPLSNYQAYVLDGQKQPVGVSGELYLGGAGLARGYVNAAELTTERFVESPFQPGAKLYKTGDRARWTADGNIEFLGRVDQQVKIRGFRVEPGEIEAQLRLLPGVREAAVIATGLNGSTRLIAYCTGEVVPENLRTGLAETLPDYMVPSAFVKLESLPLTANGKLDRKALPKPEQDAFASRTYEAPVGETEGKMAVLWAEVLKLDRVGRHDNFFEIGGHSLLAVTLVERMQQLGLPGDVRALFTTPTVAGLAGGSVARTRVEVPENRIPAGATRITPEMLPLVQLTQSQIDRLVTSVPGGAANIADIYPLAPLQEGIFFQHLMSGQGDPYLTPFLLGFDSRQKLDAFTAAVRQVMQRHDVLRSAMAWSDLDKPVQVVWRQADLPIEELTLDRESLLSQYNPQTYRMDVSVAPLLKLVVTKDKGTDRWLLLMLTHHLVLDHTSLEIVVHEIKTLIANPNAMLAEPLPYRNFIAQTLHGLSRERHESFFQQMLGDVDEPTAPFGILDTQAGQAKTIESRLKVDSALAERIRRRSRALGVTPASLFHLAWAAVLGHVSGKSDVVFGTVLFGRMDSGSGADRVVGMFINTLPMRVKLDETGAVGAVRRTHKGLADLLLHEHAPLALAQRCSGVPAPAPLFSSLFNYRYSPSEGAEAKSDSGIEIIEASERTNYPLAMAVDDSGRDFVLTALGQVETGPERVCGYLHNALAGLLDLLERSPQEPIGKLDVLSSTERKLIIETWNQTATEFATGTLDGLFTRQSKLTPDAVAVVGLNGDELSYRELDDRSTRLAKHLLSVGVGPEKVVGVKMTRSTDTVIAILGILKAGGAYLPLDPAYPSERLEYIAANAGAMLVLESIDGLSGDAELSTLVDPSRLAYVIYTSGTTGQPKGVAVPHSAAVNLAFARRACHDPLGVGDRVLAAISVGFDVSIGQLLLPLLSGATVVIAGDVKTMGAAEFWSLLADRKVTHINSVPSFFDSILESAPPAGTLSLKRLMLGGEALSGALVGRIRKAIPGIEVVNMYGPTEACIDATYHVATEKDLALAVLPIGRPLSNYQAYVLDGQKQPVGVGVSGELYLGGAGLARGYVNAAELTTERFVESPFQPGAKLYKTGDRARWTADGNIEFLGRVDQQVKIRGFRVEPGEIEAQLRLLPGVREAAVIATGLNGSTRLIAYCTGEVVPENLRIGLAETLPDYMVPSAFVKIGSLPLTANGKLDRKALPKPEQEAFASRAYEAPVGETEEKMAALWAELLKLDRVGRHDNFFEIGGHSLLAVTLIERMRQQGLSVDVRSLFTTPTVAELAASVSTHPRVEVPANLILPQTTSITPQMLPLVSLNQSQIDRIVASVPGGAANVQDIYPLAPLQEGILFQHLISGEGDPYLTPFLLGFASREKVNAFLGSLQKLIHRHDVLRTAMVWNHLEKPVQVVWRNAELAVDEVDLDRASLMSRYSPRSWRMDLSVAPLLRVVVTKDQSNDRWLVLMLTHHLVLDHTSLEILVNELGLLMADPGADLPFSPPYRNFIFQTQQAVMAEQEAFFKTLLQEVDEPTVPFGLLDVQAGGAAAIEGKLKLAPELAAKIRTRSRSLGVTPASIFHLAWAVVLGHVCGRSDDVVFGTVLFGRMQSGADADRVVGMFINTLPIRIQFSGVDVVKSVRRTHDLLSQLMLHEHTPLALAQRCSNVPAPAPLFSSLFNYRHNGPAEPQSSGDSGVEMLEASERTNYPLAMAVDDSGRDFLLSAIGLPESDPQRICGYLENALVNLLDLLETSPQTPIGTSAALPLSERCLLVEQWNKTDASFESGTLDGLFIAQAQRMPDAVAVVGLDGSELTYTQLNERSDELGRHLVSAGVSPGSVVGVRMVRSTDTVIALLGILKAGGVYLPLDPAYPADRLQYIATNAGAMLVLDSIEGLSGDAALPLLKDPARLAYVIYTSGTTGKPKGVAVSHGAAVNLAFARCAGHDPIGPGDRILAGISVGFDVSIGQLITPLLSGATIVMADDIRNLGSSEYWKLLADRKVTHINSVPSFFDSIIDDVPEGVSFSLKRIMLGGEPLSGTLVNRIQTALGGVEVANIYGPTEACIEATYHVATPADLSAAVLPIGRPHCNYQAYVLNRGMAPVGVGVTGELYLGGKGLARGYLNDAELTRERFVPNPFQPGTRLYKTGDLAKWNSAGELEFMGRVDQQVKIRGFRVEPGEIEAQLRLLPGVREAAVVTDGSAPSTRLIAYWTGEIEGKIAGDTAPEALRAALASTLPDYMVPAAFIKLDQLPLTPNGKLDRKALPKPDSGAFASRAYEAPVGEIEQKMAALWAEALKLDRVGRNDNFFEIGGDSLSAMRLVQSMNQAFGRSVPIRLMFQNPTISSLSEKLSPQSSMSYGQNLVPLHTGGTKPPIYFVHASSGHVFRYLSLVKALGEDQPVYGLQASGLEAGEALGESIESMAGSYIDAIKEIQPAGPYRVLGYSSGGLIAFEMAHQFRARGDEVDFVAILDTTLPDRRGKRTASSDEVVLDMASGLGIADLVAKIRPLPSLAELVEMARQAGRLPADLETAHVERMADVFRNTVRTSPDYRMRKWPGPLLLVRAKVRPREAGPLVNWSPYVSGSLDVVDLDCSHPNLIAPEMVQQVAAAINSRTSMLSPEMKATKPASIAATENGRGLFGSVLKKIRGYTGQKQ